MTLARGVPWFILLSFLCALLAACASHPPENPDYVLLTHEQLGLADGQVVRYNPQEQEAWINLGTKDRLRPGITFTCYDSTRPLPFARREALAFDEEQIHGTLEVVEVGPTEARCRITQRNKRHPIQDGDLVVNLLFHTDRTRTFRFVFVGDFDLNGDGTATVAERERVEYLISKWGGRIDPDLSARTDYLIAGARPADPTVRQNDPADVGPETVRARRAQDQKRYDAAMARAQRLAIPALNPNRFLDLIGFPDMPLTHK